MGVMESKDLRANCPRGSRPRDLARSLNVANSVVYEAISKGEMKVWRIGKAIVIPEEEVQRWLESKMEPTAA